MALELEVTDRETAQYWRKWAARDGIAVSYPLLPSEWASVDVEKIPAEVIARAKGAARELDAEYKRLNIPLARDRACWRWFIDTEPFPYHVGFYRGWVDALGNDLKERLYTGDERKRAKRSWAS